MMSVLNARAETNEPETVARVPSSARRWAAVVATWLLAAAVLAVMQLGRMTPTAFVDELVFGRVAENIGRGAGETFQGLPLGVRSIYPYVIAPAWSLFDGETAYRIALALNALVMTSVVLPAYAMALRVTSHRRALAAAACAALVPAMVWSGMLMTEAVAYPVTAWALLAMVRALDRPTLRGVAALAAVIVVAYLIRTQLVALIGVFMGAVLLDLLRGGRAEIITRARRHRVILAVAGTAALGLGTLVLAGGRSLGTYSCVVAQPPAPGELAGPVIDYAGTMYVATLGIPLIALLALAARRANWRDPRLGALLSVGVSGVVVFVLVASWTAVTVSPELQERYVFYPAPVLLAVLCTLPERGRLRDVAVVAVATTVYALALFPGFADVTGDVVAGRLGLSGPLASALGSRPLLWGAVFAGAGIAAAVAVRRGGRSGAVVALAATAAFGSAALLARQIDANQTSAEVRDVLPVPLDVIDRTTNGEPAGLVAGRGSSSATLFGLQLWNEHADRTFRLGIADAYGAGQLCPITVRSGGELQLKRPCGGRPLPRWLVFLDQKPRISLANGVVRFNDRGVRLVEFTADKPPRLALTSPASAEGLSAPDTPPAEPNVDQKRCNER